MSPCLLCLHLYCLHIDNYLNNFGYHPESAKSQNIIGMYISYSFIILIFNIDSQHATLNTSLSDYKEKEEQKKNLEQKGKEIEIKFKTECHELC